MNKRLKVAYSEKALNRFGRIGTREAVLLSETDFTDVGAVLITEEDEDITVNPQIRAFHIPLFLIIFSRDKGTDKIGSVYSIVTTDPTERKLFERQVESAVRKYEESILPPFFKSLLEYVEMGNAQFDCPGHQGGAYFRKYPGGRIFYDFLGENIFRADLCNADVMLGDLLIHEGPALLAQKHAAQVFNADKAYFVLNGTSGPIRW